MFDLSSTDVSRQEIAVEIPGIDEPWQIGLIVGPSGSGKTTIARRAFGSRVDVKWEWPVNESILDGFPKQMNLREIVSLLSSVGFSSPPSWVRPFCALSNGEQFRVNLARALAETVDIAVVDEFTSVVDRTVAKIGSSAIAKAIRKGKGEMHNRSKRFVAVSCHYDIADWLDPDWIVDMADRSLTRYSPAPGDARRLRRPPITLHIERVDSSAWKIFQRHHYLSDALHRSACCFIASVENRPAAFTAALHFPHPRRSGWREHRTVCLPDFQGVGIGNVLSEFVAGLFVTTGKPYSSVTSHPGMIRHRAGSPLWRMTRPPSRLARQAQWRSSGRRITASFEYRGPRRSIEARGFGIL
jgi:hypothetical protein